MLIVVLVHIVTADKSEDKSDKVHQLKMPHGYQSRCSFSCSYFEESRSENYVFAANIQIYNQWFDWILYLLEIYLLTSFLIQFTRSSGRYAPFILAPAEGWGPFGPPRALRALLGAFGPQ